MKYKFKRRHYEKKYENIKHEGNSFIQWKIKLKVCCVYGYDRDKDRESKKLKLTG